MLKDSELKEQMIAAFAKMQAKAALKTDPADGTSMIEGLADLIINAVATYVKSATIRPDMFQIQPSSVITIGSPTTQTGPAALVPLAPSFGGELTLGDLQLSAGKFPPGFPVPAEALPPPLPPEEPPGEIPPELPRYPYPPPGWDPLPIPPNLPYEPDPPLENVGMLELELERDKKQFIPRLDVPQRPTEPYEPDIPPEERRDRKPPEEKTPPRDDKRKRNP